MDLEQRAKECADECAESAWAYFRDDSFDDGARWYRENKNYCGPMHVRESLLKPLILAALQEAVEQERNRVCEWNEVGELWEASCGLNWMLTNDGTPKENEMHYCPKCGGKIIVKAMKTWDLTRTEAEFIVDLLEKDRTPLAHHLSAELRLLFGMVSEQEEKERSSRRQP